VPKQYWGAQKVFNDESAQITLGGMKNLNDWKGPYKAGGHEEKSKGFKIFEQKQKKRVNAMMLKTKWRKQKMRKSPSLALGGTVDHFTNQIQGPEMYEQKSLGYKH
jgi:hypothetical protein